MFYIGIDIGKSNHEVSIVDQEGNLLAKSLSFANSQAGFEKLLAYFTKHNVSFTDSILGVEATDHYWLALYSHLIEKDFQVHVINPIQSDSFRNFYVRQTKTDSIDSFIIAEVMRFGRYSTTSTFSENMVELKSLTRFRTFHVDEISKLKVKVITLLDQVFPEYKKLFSDVFGASSKELLSEYQLPEQICNLDNDKLIEVLNQASRGRLGEEKALQIKSATENSFGISFATESFAFQIKQLIESIKFAEKQLADLEEKISSLFITLDSSIITTITGIGNVTGAAIISEIGDINRFSEPSKLVAFAGLDASVRQSGSFNSTSNHLSKRGSPFLRRAIWSAAFIAAFKDPTLSKFYQSLRDKGKPHMIALGAVSRKLCNIMPSLKIMFLTILISASRFLFFSLW